MILVDRLRKLQRIIDKRDAEIVTLRRRNSTEVDVDAAMERLQAAPVTDRRDAREVRETRLIGYPGR